MKVIFFLPCAFLFFLYNISITIPIVSRFSGTVMATTDAYCRRVHKYAIIMARGFETLWIEMEVYRNKLAWHEISIPH